MGHEMQTKRQVFFSFHFARDAWRAGQVRNIRDLDGNTPVSDNDWEQVKRGGDAAIQNWIENQLKYRSCTIVLIGTETAGRRWVNYEIKRSWELGKAVLGIYVHNLQDSMGTQSPKGPNPFANFNLNGIPFDRIVPVYCTEDWNQSTEVYKKIALNIDSWVENAIKIRQQYP